MSLGVDDEAVSPADPIAVYPRPLMEKLSPLCAAVPAVQVMISLELGAMYSGTPSH